MSINAASHIPVYEQIVEYIRGSIAAGIHHPGETLPSVRMLALELVVNPNTVQRAYQELERAGLVRSRKGVGMFVSEQSPESARNSSETAVQASFSQGIAIGKRADLPTDRMRTVFDKAITDATRDQRQAEDKP